MNDKLNTIGEHKMASGLLAIEDEEMLVSYSRLGSFAIWDTQMKTFKNGFNINKKVDSACLFSVEVIFILSDQYIYQIDIIYGKMR